MTPALSCKNELIRTGAYFVFRSQKLGSVFYIRSHGELRCAYIHNAAMRPWFPELENSAAILSRFQDSNERNK